MIWLYRLLFIPAFFIAIPYYALRMIRRGGYAKDFSHRFGGQKNLPDVAKGKTRVWIQAVSVGEVEAISTLVDKFAERNDIELVITTTTSTGRVSCSMEKSRCHPQALLYRMSSSLS